ncbi:hypothetical protein [Burkholderia ubonensis]|uniref:hypothetical protein n=1 Tax=Burkholderia ubonensis TaxID=101571 RepID=UPI0012FB9FC6|nr:hypothetical protein [Burkholderia ubonensis]
MSHGHADGDDEIDVFEVRRRIVKRVRFSRNRESGMRNSGGRFELRALGPRREMNRARQRPRPSKWRAHGRATLQLPSYGEEIMCESHTFDVLKQEQQDWLDAQSGNRAQQPA